MRPLFLFGLDATLGSRFAEVTETESSLTIQSSNIGMVWIYCIAGALLICAILFGTLKRRAEPRAWDQGLTSIAVVSFCLIVMVGLNLKDARLLLRQDSEAILIENRGILGPFWMQRERVPLVEIRAIGIGHATIKAATRNGTPISRDKDGYFLRLDRLDRSTAQGTPAMVEGSAAVAKAVLILLTRVNAHPARAGNPVATNLARYGYRAP